MNTILQILLGKMTIKKFAFTA